MTAESHRLIMEIEQDFFSDDDGIQEDSEIDNKVNRSVSMTNLKFLNYNSRQKVCVTQYILILNDRNLCLTCFYDVVSELDLIIESQHVTQHFTGSVNELIQKCVSCTICGLNLHQFSLAQFCILCNHCTQ